MLSHNRQHSVSVFSFLAITFIMGLAKFWFWPLRKECPYLELFKSVFFPHSDWIRRYTDTFYAVDLFFMVLSAKGLCDYYVNFCEIYFKLYSRDLKLKEIHFAGFLRRSKTLMGLQLFSSHLSHCSTFTNWKL